MSDQLHHGSRHHGAVQFEVSTSATPAARCNRQPCHRRGALRSSPFPAGQLRIIRSEDA